MNTIKKAAFTAVAKSGHEQVLAFFTSEARANAWCESMVAAGYGCSAVEAVQR